MLRHVFMFCLVVGLLSAQTDSSDTDENSAVAKINQLRALIAKARVEAADRNDYPPVKHAREEDIKTVSQPTDMPTFSEGAATEASSDLKPMQSLLQAQEHLKKTMLVISSEKKHLNALREQESNIQHQIADAKQALKNNEAQLKIDSKTMMETAEKFDHKVEKKPTAARTAHQFEEKAPQKAGAQKAGGSSFLGVPANSDLMKRFSDKMRLAAQKMEINSLKAALNKKLVAVEVAPIAKPATQADPVADAEKQRADLLEALRNELTSR